MDQVGALFGPLLVAVVLSSRGHYRAAFAILFFPALVVLGVLLGARFLYPRPEDLEPAAPSLAAKGLTGIFWVYLGGAALVAVGFADFSLIAYHFKRPPRSPPYRSPLFYSVAMAVSGLGSLGFGRLFDRVGILILAPLTVISALFAPLVFLGNYWLTLIGSALWGLGMGVHESIIPAAVALMVPRTRRPSAYGTFTSIYGVAWFVGSAITGIFYDRSIPAVILFCVACQLAAIPIFLSVRKQLACGGQPPS